MSRSAELVILDQHHREREQHKIPYGSNLSRSTGY